MAQGNQPCIYSAQWMVGMGCHKFYSHVKVKAKLSFIQYNICDYITFLQLELHRKVMVFYLA